MNRPGPKAGYSLIEMLFVIALMGLTLLIVAPRGAVLTDRIVAHAVFFDFQRQVADLRRDADREQAPLVLYDPTPLAKADPRGRIIELRAGWSYRLSGPLAISAGGACSPADAKILHGARSVMHLVAMGADCKFTRIG